MTTETVRVFGTRDSSVGFRSNDGTVPKLEQYVRDYVDKRSVWDGMIVLDATVEDGDVTELEINGRCATDRAKDLHDTDSNVDITYSFGGYR